MKRRAAIARLVAGATGLAVARGALAAQSSGATGLRSSPPRLPITVYKSASCGCCAEWVKHMERSGFQVTARNVEDVDAIAAQMGVPEALRSCHTAVAGRYVVSGHVPGDLVRQLLREAPGPAVGIAVPGMPAGSPGMESPRPERYQVIEWRRDGTTRVFASR